MLKRQEFVKLSDDKLKELLRKNLIYFPPRFKQPQLSDYALNKLHGIEFINDNEITKDGKLSIIIKEPKKVEKKKCPKCNQKQLTEFGVPSDHIYSGYMRCSFCGITLTADEYKNFNKNVKESKS